MRRILLWTAGAATVMVALGVIAIVALSYGWQRDALREQVETRLADALRAPVSIESIEGALHREVTVRGLRIGEPAAPLVDVASLRLSVGSLTIARTPTLTLDAVTLSGAHLVPSRYGEVGWPEREAAATGSEPGAPGGTSGGWPLLLRLGALAIEGVRIEVVQEAGESTWVDVSGGLTDVTVGEGASVGDANLSFTATGGTSEPQPWMLGAARGSYAAGRWRVAELRVEGPLLELDAHGAGTREVIDEAELSLAVESISVLAQRLLGDDGSMGGSIDLSARLHGPLAWPEGSLSLRARALSGGGVDLGDLQLEARSSGEGRLQIDALRFDRGPLALRADSGAELLADAKGTTLEALRLRTADGRGTLRIDASVPHAASPSLASLLELPEARVALRSVAWPAATLQPLWTQFGLELGGVLDADLVVSGAAGGPTASGDARLARGQLGFAAARAEGIDLELVFEGSIEAPRISGTGSVARLFYEDHALGALDFAASALGRNGASIDRLLLDGPTSLRVVPGARLEFVDSGVRFEDFAIEGDGQRIALAGGLSAHGADALRLELSPLDVRRATEVMERFGWSPAKADLSGRIEGHLVFDGPHQQPDLSGELAWTEARLGDVDFDGIEARLTTESSAVRIASRWIRGGADALHLDASLPNDRILTAADTLIRDPRSRWTARTDGFELAALAPFLPRTISALGGVLDAGLEARGGGPGLDLSGHASLREGSVRLAALGGQTLAPIRARLELAGQRLSLEELRIGEAGSGVRGEGEARIDGTALQSIDLRLDFESFPIQAPGLVSGTLAGPLALSGVPGGWGLEGRLELGDLKLRIPEPDDAALKEIRVISSDREATTRIVETNGANALLDPLRVDLDVAIARNSWARGRGAEVEVKGALEARKDSGQPLGISGTVETVRGTYEIYGRRFRIERGRAVLDGAAEVDPVLDVRALHRVRGIRIFAIVEGRLSEPHLRFESDPELSETDIASYLLLGRPASDVGSEQQPALDAVAAQIAAGAALREFEQVFGGALPVDLVDVRMDGEGEDSELRAGVGNYVGDRLLLYYERGFGDEPENELKAEYELTPSWSVESTVTAEGETAADLIFEIEY